MADWIPVTERLPDKPGKYLVRYDILGCVNSADTDILWFTDNLYQMNKYAFPGKKNKRPGFYSVDNEYGEAEWDCVTHWQPLPEPPKEEHSPVYESLKRGLEQAINGETREEETE